MTWTKGQSGNPSGRTPTAAKYERPIRLAEKQIADRLPWLVDKMLDLANGVTVQESDHHGGTVVYDRPPDRQAAEYLINRIMGKPTERQELSGPDGGPIEVDDLSDAERARRIAAILDTARGRAAGQTATGSESK